MFLPLKIRARSLRSGPRTRGVDITQRNQRTVRTEVGQGIAVVFQNPAAARGHRLAKPIALASPANRRRATGKAQAPAMGRMLCRSPFWLGSYASNFNDLEVAERVRFELTVESPPRRISSAVHSTTLPPLREALAPQAPSVEAAYDTGGFALQHP